MKTRKTITVTGITAHYILNAERSSFYGINGNTPSAYSAKRFCTMDIFEYLDFHKIKWDSMYILEAHNTHDDIPYKAEITFDIYEGE